MTLGSIRRSSIRLNDRLLSSLCP
ncbi:UNVERIFIED_CONTAM: hypothetical protein GTU68_013539 [Idotea baltica]|nr:hypothetical protein [Idotea baltica]